ncbi:MAG: hypothetical protein E6614_25300, partial [Bradyrhizobium sp.]|nr:hypothetical protein [Bradyrhizobium sp.]
MEASLQGAIDRQSGLGPKTIAEVKPVSAVGSRSGQEQRVAATLLTISPSAMAATLSTALIMLSAWIIFPVCP